MAKKVNELKLAQENWGQAEVTNRRGESPALFLTQAWMPRFRVAQPKKKLPIFMDADTRAEVSRPVKIRHIA